MHESLLAPNPVMELNHARPVNRWLHCEGSPESQAGGAAAASASCAESACRVASSIED